MKLLRLLLLILSLAAAALSVSLLANLTFDGLLPVWLLARTPALAILLRWIPDDVRTVALAAGIAAMLCFGLALPPPRRAPQPEASVAPVTRAALLRVVLALSVGAALLLLAGDRWLGLNGWLLALVWGVWMALLVVLGGALDGRPPRPNPVPGAAPEASWLWLLPILLVAGSLSLWDAGALPAGYPPAAYAAGLQAQAPNLAAGPFAVGSAGLPEAATLLAAAGQAVTRDPFWGGALAGTVAALALVAAVWLLGCELFRRTPAGEPGELPDDGRVPALLAALALAGMMPSMHAARLPWLLEPAVWGVLGLWALLRALRTGRTQIAVLGGAALGLAALGSPAGWVFAGAGVALVAAWALARRNWLAAAYGGIGAAGLLLAAAALAITAAASVCVWGCGRGNPLAETAAARGGIDAVLAALGLSVDAVATSDHSITIGLILAPLLLLALGGLLFRLDQPAAWLLLPWLALSIGVAARHASHAAVVDWPSLALALPAVALAVAFALDVLGGALLASAGPWTPRAVTTLAVGLLALNALLTWADYPRAAGVAQGGATPVARAVAALPASAPVTLLDNGSGLDWNNTALRFALAGDGRSVGMLRADAIAGWEAPPGAVVLVMPGMPESLPALRARLPQAQVETARDVLGNPTLYTVRVP